MDAISKIKDSAYIGTNGLFATDALVSYKQQLEGLTATQQKMALMGTNLSEAQRKQVLQFMAATAATKTLTAEQVLSCTADEKQILVKAGLITEEQLEKGSTIELTKIKQEEILANEALSVSDKNTILNKFGVTGANLTEASSWKVLGKSIAKATLEKLKWLATTPEGWITLAVAAIVGAIAAYVKWGDTLENTREKLEDLKSECDTITSEIESVNGELETTKQRLEELAGKPSLTFTEKEEYDNLVKQNNELQRQLDLQKLLLDEKNKKKNETFVSAMEKDIETENEFALGADGKTSRGYGRSKQDSPAYQGGLTERGAIEQELTNYQDNLNKIADLDEQYKDDLSNKKYLKERARIEKENEKISKYLQEKNAEFVTASEGIDYIEEPKNEDEEKVNKWLDFINDFQDKMAIAMGGDNAKANAFNRVVDNWQFDDVTQELQDLGKEGKVTADMLNDPKYDEFIKKLVDLGVIDSADNLEAVALAFNNVANSANATADAGDKATASLSDFEKVSDNIGKLSSAYKELSDDGYITIKTINEIKEATGLSGDEWAEYETKLLNAKKGSAEFNQVMSDLTYKMIENQVSVGDLTNATDEEVKAIENKIAATLRENGVTNASAVAHDYVRMARVNEAIAAYDGTQASYDSASALISESLSADQAKIAMNQLEIAKRMVNSQQIKTASDIDEIIALANAAGASTQMLQDLARAKSELADGFVGPVSPTTQKILDGEYTPTFNKLNPSDYKVITPEYVGGKSSGGGSKSSSDKNDALDNYLEDAERRYKIHQDETKYINDLDYALSNLVRTEEERRDVLDEIEQARKDYANNQVKDLEHQIEMAQNLKGENADVLDYYRQIQEIAHNEANRLRSIGYDDNSDEIQEWQSKWWDTQDKKLDFYNTQHEVIIRDIEHARDMALAKNPYADTTSYYKQMQDEYHKMAEMYRSINPEKYKAEIQELQQAWWDAQSSMVDWRWENSQNWISQRNTYGDWDKFADNEVNAWERVLKWLKTEFPNSLDKICEAEQSFYEAIKKERDDAVAAAEKFRSELEETYDVENKRYERLITKEQGLLDIKTKSFDITNKLADAQHEADKAIADSRISKKYLTAEEYALIYNEDDYSKITGKIKEIATVAESLTKSFQNQIAEAYANGQDYLVEYITAEYERQLEMKERELEIAQAEVDLVKKKQQLENVLAEKNVRQMVEKDGRLQWDWVADTDKVRSATEEYSEAQYAIDKAEAERKQQNILNSMQQSIDVWNRSISANDANLSDLDDAITKLKNNVDTLNNPVVGFNAAVKSLEEQGIPSLSRALNDVLKAFEDVTGNEYDKVTVPNGNIVKVQENGFAPKGLSSGTMVETAGGYYLITDVNEDGSYQSIRTHYAKGTNNTKSGSALMGEDGFEAFIQKNGHLLPITQPTLFGDIDAGGKVFNAEQMKNLGTLWDMSQFKTPDYSSLVNKYSSASTDNSVTLNGDIVVQNPADFNDFTRKLTNAFRRKD